MTASIAAIVFAGFSAGAVAQNFPSKPIRVVLPYPSPSPEDFQKFIERDTAAWARVVKPLNLQLD